MGITGLLPVVKPACISVNLSDLTDTVAVIDGYGWLHRSTIGVAYDIYKGKHMVPPFYDLFESAVIRKFVLQFSSSQNPPNRQHRDGSR